MKAVKTRFFLETIKKTWTTLARLDKETELTTAPVFDVWLPKTTWPYPTISKMITDVYISLFSNYCLHVQKISLSLYSILFSHVFVCRQKCMYVQHTYTYTKAHFLLTTVGEKKKRGSQGRILNLPYPLSLTIHTIF